MTTEIVAFIRTRLHDDRFSAEQAGAEWPPGDEIASQVESIRVGAHIARHDPARVLRGVEAKRRILDEVVTEIESLDDRLEIVAGGTEGEHEESRLLLRMLASEWSTHDDYRQEWA